jgi:hypothetical protein
MLLRRTGFYHLFRGGHRSEVMPRGEIHGVDHGVGHLAGVSIENPGAKISYIVDKTDLGLTGSHRCACSWHHDGIRPLSAATGADKAISLRTTIRGKKHEHSLLYQSSLRVLTVACNASKAQES